MIISDLYLLQIGGCQRALGFALIQLLLGNDLALEKALTPLVKVIGQSILGPGMIQCGLESGNVDFDQQIVFFDKVTLTRSDPLDAPGGIGGYLMRVIKSSYLGTRLSRYYEEQEQRHTARVENLLRDIRESIACRSATPSPAAGELLEEK